MFAVPTNTIALPTAPGSGHPARVAIEFARDRDRWVSSLRYDPDERFAALVHSAADHEIWLLSWLPGQHTDVHDHGIASGAFTVVTGSLTETVSRTTAVTGHVVTEGRTRVFGPGYTHQVRNLGPDPAVSIHVYRPARP